MTKEEILLNLKAQEVNECFLIDITVRQMEKACSAWLLSEVRLDIEEMNIEDVWKHCLIDMDKWHYYLGFVPDGGFFKKLILSGLLYPDGTFNEKWLKDYKRKLFIDKILAKKEKKYE